MSFKRFLAWLTMLAIFTMAMRISIASDTWWHLRAGSWMLENGQLLKFDLFSLTRHGEPWIYPGWISQVLMAGLFRLLGFAGLNLLTALSVVVAFRFVWQVTEAPALLKAFVFILGASASGVFWSARPQILSFALTGVLLWSLTRARNRGPRELWITVALMALWANLHGGFAIGFLLIGVELVALLLSKHLPSGLQLAQADSSVLEPRHLGIAAVASAAAVSVNPHGPQMLLYPFRTVSIQVLQDYIQEWQSPNFHNAEVQPFLWMLLLTLAFLALSPRRPSWREIITVGLFAYLALVAGRNIALFGLLTTPVLAVHISHTFGARWPQSGSQFPERIARAINAVLLLLLALAAMIKSVEPLSEAANEAAIGKQAPVPAAEYMLEHQPPGPLFNTYNWGSYVIWKLHPQYLSFVDGRTDLFDDELLGEYLTAWRADPGWESVMEKWDIRLALLEPAAPLARELRAAGWDPTFQDQQSIVLERRD